MIVLELYYAIKNLFKTDLIELHNSALDKTKIRAIKKPDENKPYFAHTIHNNAMQLQIN